MKKISTKENIINKDKSLSGSLDKLTRSLLQFQLYIKPIRTNIKSVTEPAIFKISENIENNSDINNLIFFISLPLISCII